MAEAEYKTKIGSLAQSTHALAAIGAVLRLRHEGIEPPTEVRLLLEEAIAQMGLPSPDELDAGEIERLVTAVDFHLRHAGELFGQPARPPGWDHADPNLLEAQGAMSRAVVHMIAAAAATRPALAATLDRPGKFLDVGMGVGRLAIEAARTWPKLQVVGIDIWEPALAAARRNVAAAGLEARVEVRVQNLLTLSDHGVFALIWLPLTFLDTAALATALPRVREALAPEAWVVCGMNAQPADPVARTLAALRTLRGGGQERTAEEVATLLVAAGYAGVEVVSSGPLDLVLGQRSDV